MNPRMKFAAMCVALLMAFALTARGQVLKQVPANSMVVVKFKNLKATSDKMGALATKFGLAQLNPAAGDPLGSFKQSINATNGVKDDGDAAVAVMMPAEGTEKPDFVVLLPVADYKAFIANYPDAKTEGDISTIKLPNRSEDEPGYVAQWGDYAAISETKDILAKKPEAGLSPSGLAAKELESKDITVYANMKVIRDRALPKLQKSHQEIKDKISQEIAQKNPNAEKYQGITNTVIDELMGLAEQFLQQSQAATFGIDFSEDAIHPTGVVEFDPASNWGQTVAKVKNSNEPLLVGMPDLKYLFLMGISIDADSANKVIDDLVAPVQGELAKLGDEGKAIQNYVNAMKTIFTATTSQSGGLVAPTGALGQGSLFQSVGVMNGKADQILDAQRQAFNSQQAVMSAMGTQAQVTTSYTANAKTLDGVQLNQFTTKFTPAENPTPQEAQVQQMMTWMYGPNGMNGYSGAVTPERAIMGMGVSDETMSKLIASAKAADTKLAQSEGIQQVSAQLPKQRIMAMYIPLDNLATTIISYAKQFGMPINVQLPENLQPIGITGGTEGSAIRMDGVIPAGTIQSLVSAGLQAYNNMMQGPRGGGAGQGAP